MKHTKKPQPPNKITPHYLIIILIFTTGVLLYLRTLLKGVFLFDDQALIIDNPLIKNFSYIKDIFVTHLYHGSGIYSNFYRPIQSLSFMLDYHFWQLNPFGYHLTSVIIHILVAVSVYFLIYILSKKQDAALIAGMLFCVHTVLSGVPNYVAARADLLSALFFIVGIISYILYREMMVERRGIFLYLTSMLCFIVALLSKEIAVVFPFILLLYLSCFSKEQKQPKKKKPNLIWPFFIIIAVYVLLRVTVLDFTGGKLVETTTAPIPLYNRLLTTSKVFMIYLRLLVLPIGLHMEWNIEPARSFLQDEVFLSVVGLFIIGCFGYFISRTSKLKFFGIAWFFIMLVPYSNIYPIAYFMGQDWLYMPSVGFFALLAIYLSELGRRSRWWGYTVICITTSLILFYGLLTFKRADVWADPVNLYVEVLRYSPNNTKARINLGVLLARAGSHEEAMKRYKEVAKILPRGSSEVHGNIGSIHADNKRYGMALQEFERAVELNPNDYVAHTNIGIIYKKSGNFKRAEEKYKKALSINPNHALAYNNLGNIYLQTKRYDKAIDYYKKAIELSPHMAPFYENLGKAYRENGMYQKARESFEKALQLDPALKDAKSNLKSLN